MVVENNFIKAAIILKKKSILSLKWQNKISTRISIYIIIIYIIP